MPPCIPNYYQIQDTHCECCRPKWTTITSTAGFHKWTEKEIRAEIVEISLDLSKKKWYESKSYLRERLNHWCQKLDRLLEVKSEFKV